MPTCAFCDEPPVTRIRMEIPVREGKRERYRGEATLHLDQGLCYDHAEFVFKHLKRVFPNRHFEPGPLD